MSVNGAATVALASQTLLLLIAVDAIFGVAMAFGLPSPTTHADVWSVASSVSHAVAGVGAIAFAIRRGVQMSWAVGRRQAGPAQMLRATLGCALVLAGICLLLAQIEFATGEGFGEVSVVARIVDWSSLVLVTPVLEELLFRGILLRSLLDRTSNVAAVLASAAVFSGFHPSIVGVTYTFGLGLVLGALLVRTGSIWPCIALHSAYNFTVRVLEALRTSQDATSDVAFSLLVALIIDAALIVGLVLLMRLGRGQTERS
jgi:membrane protease YdiL (CAAX protease family)